MLRLRNVASRVFHQPVDPWIEDTENCRTQSQSTSSVLQQRMNVMMLATSTSSFVVNTKPDATGSKTNEDWSLLFYMAGVSLVALHFVAVPFLAPAFRKNCLPYVAANDIQLKLLTDSLRKNKVKRVVDLGSGDGVVCIHLAKELGIMAVGYELNPWLVVFSKVRAFYRGVGNLCTFHQKDLFKADVSKDDGVVLFVVPSMMEALEAKLMDELRQDAKVYAMRFPLHSWKEEQYASGPSTGGYNVNQLWVYPNPRDQKLGA